MDIFSLRGLAKACRERLRIAPSLRAPFFAPSEDEGLTGKERLETGDQPGAWTSAGGSPLDSAGSGSTIWRDKLTLASAQLHQVSVSTEGEFLAIGERFQDFYSRAEEITSLVSGLVGQLGGEKGIEAMTGLAGMLDSLEENLDDSAQQGGQQALASILEQLQQVTAPLTGFGQMNKMLEMFGMYTKIESARLGARAEGFQSLAKDVTRLSGEVSRKADTVLLQKGELAGVIREALAAVVTMGAEKQAEILGVLAKTRESLNLLTTIVDRCSSSAGRISAASHEVTGDLGQVVVSLQAHDTVRQQVEHVVEALDELAARLPQSVSFLKMGAGDDGHLVMESGTLCRIQAEQLRHASTELVTAVESIVASLRDIAARETAMADDSRDLVGVTDQAGTSFFAEMGSDLTAVIAMLTATASTNRRLSEVMNTVAETVGGIFRFVDEIETIAYDIKLIALNFLIQASALGNEGSGLGVLAEAIRRLSEEARVQAGGVTELLTEIKSVTDGMRQGAHDGSASLETRVSEMRQRVEEMLASLRELSDGMSQGLSLAHAKAETLSGDIDEVTAGITVHRQVGSVLTEAGTMLDGIVSQAKALLPGTDWSLATERLRAADSRYTMHSERNVHAAVVNANLGMVAGEEEPKDDFPEAAALVPPGSSNDELGDNVELF